MKKLTKPGSFADFSSHENKYKSEGMGVMPVIVNQATELLHEIVVRFSNISK